jgi:hypothetical protein
MRRARTQTVRDVSSTREADAAPAKRLPQRGTTKQMHERLLHALRDRRVKRAFH